MYLADSLCLLLFNLKISITYERVFEILLFGWWVFSLGEAGVGVFVVCLVGWFCVFVWLGFFGCFDCTLENSALSFQLLFLRAIVQKWDKWTRFS